ncbi:MAG: hypothetical protein CMP56_04565 [Flavobacteriales bacterium]|nr:hypothetical protein [Flavobacteriales bacterium]|tara:strand:- start:578 stop:1192 length:615 start_codon:yes stop_codon:yes gene_type:complete
MSRIEFSISNVIEKSWVRFKTNPFFWIGLAFLNIIITPPAGLPPIINFPVTLLGLYVSASITLMSIKYMRGESVGLRDLTSIDFKVFFNYILFTITALVGVIIGLFLFILPGLYIAVRLIFAPFLIVDQKMGFDEAIEKSWQMTSQNTGKITTYFLTILLMVVVGFFLFLFGFIVAVAVIGLSNATLYLTFLDKHNKYLNHDLD